LGPKHVEQRPGASPSRKHPPDAHSWLVKQRSPISLLPAATHSVGSAMIGENGSPRPQTSPLPQLEPFGSQPRHAMPNADAGTDVGLAAQ
jgi:hypothetical protein